MADEPVVVVEEKSADAEVVASVARVEADDAANFIVSAVENATFPDSSDNAWHELLPQLKLTGMAQQLAEHCLLQSPLNEQVEGKVNLLLDQSGETLYTTRTAEALIQALQTYTGNQVQVEFTVSDVLGETPEKRRIRLQKEQQIAAERAIEDDPIIQQLQQKWGGVVIPGSVKPNKDVDAS